jgi:hypothetical protein
MNLIFLGVASALSNGYNSNILIEDKKNAMLFDCGEDIKHSLRAAGRKVEELNSVYISHLHSDHCYGLSWLGYYSYFILKRKINLYIHESLVNELWCMLSPAMNKLQGGCNFETLATYFNVRSIPDDDPIFSFGTAEMELIKNKHISSFVGNMYSYGLLIKDDSYKKGIYISADTMFIPPGTIWNEKIDFVFQDVDVFNLGGVHCNYNVLKEMPLYYKERIWLYHYTDLSKYDGKYGEMPDAVADGFAGFVKEGQVFEF